MNIYDAAMETEAKRINFCAESPGMKGCFRIAHRYFAPSRLIQKNFRASGRPPMNVSPSLDRMSVLIAGSIS